MADLATLPAWVALQTEAAGMQGKHVRDLLDQPGRFTQFSRQAGNVLLDFSRNRVTTQTLGLLIDLAKQRDLPGRIEALFAGKAVNVTENRPAQHMALRNPAGPPLVISGKDIRAEIAAEMARMLEIAEAIRSGRFRGASGARIRHVVNIGIGGSDLGIVMVNEALRSYVEPGISFHYVSNVDGSQLADLTGTVAAAETLFVVCSKTFLTWETALNAAAARCWIVEQLGEAATRQHFLAVSVNSPAMDSFGIAPEHRFGMWDWVGGRYSLWSPIGLTIAIAIGADNFRAMLSGAHQLDEHFRVTRLEDNLPVLLALIAVWNQNFLGTTSQVILPYAARLNRFPAYLQQLEMESNGKGVGADGEPVQWSTGTIIWGESGSNAQHSFFQLLHQGTTSFAADFIAPVAPPGGPADQHLVGLANMLAQAEAFARGHPPQSVRAELEAKGLPPVEIDRLMPHKVHPGNRPANILLLRRLDPQSLGFLIALYEHKVFVQSCIWGINPFDQWGVELGKSLASGMHAALLDTDGVAPMPEIGHTIRNWRL